MNAPGGDPALALTALGVRFPGRREPALDGVDLAVHAGELVGLGGRNGAGKTTLALAAAGFIPRVIRGTVSGSVRIAGRDTRGIDPAALVEQAGIVFAAPASQLSGSKITVREELAFGLENLGVARVEMDARIERTMAELGIAHLAERSPAAISGGEQQRVAIAAVLCMGPGILLLDEPAAHLDPSGTRGVAGLLADRAAAGMAVLVAEHRSIVLAGAGRIAVLDGGRLVAEAAPAVALMPGVGGAAGLETPVLLRLAAVLELEPSMAFDETALAAAIRRSRVGGDSPAATVPPPSTAARITSPVPGVHPASAAIEWGPVRDHPPAGLRADGLVHRYPGGFVGLDGIDLEIGPGETVAIVGRNGAGKTTLARLLAGMTAPTAGRIAIGGADIAGRAIAAVARSVGFVHADPDRQLFSRTVELEVAFGPRNLGLDAGATHRLVDQALRVTGLDGRRSANPHDLGPADRRLVALASILAMDPAVLVLDEPTSTHDAAGVARVGAIVDALAAAGRTVVAVTHDTELAARHFRRIVVLRDGRIVADGPPGVVLGAANAALLASTGLEPPPIARLAGLLGLGAPVPLTAEDLLARLGMPALDSHPA